MDNPTHDSVDSIPFHGLKIWTDGPDKKAPEVSTASNLPLEQGEEGTAPKEGQPKLDAIIEEEEKQAQPDIRRRIEEVKYKLYIGQLSMEESDLDMHTDRSKNPFLD